MEINIHPVLTGDIKAQVDELLDETFGEKSGKSPEELAANRDKFYATPYAWVVGTIDGVVVGSVELYLSRIRYQGVPIILGGLGGVNVKASFRGRGLSSPLVKRGMTELAASGVDVAYLCCNYDDSKIFHLYGSAGYVIYKKPVIVVGKSGRIYPQEWAMLAPVGSREKFDLLFNSPDGFSLQGSDW